MTRENIAHLEWLRKKLEKTDSNLLKGFTTGYGRHSRCRISERTAYPPPCRGIQELRVCRMFS